MPAGADFGRREYAFTLVEDDNGIGFADASSSVMENVDSGMAIVPVSVSGLVPSPIALDVSVETNETTATQGEDYALATQSLTIEAGQESATIQINIANESQYEGDEDVVLSIAASEILPRGWSLGTASHKFTIQNDDREVSFTSTSPPQTMEDNGDTVSQVLLIRPRPAANVSIPIIVEGNAESYSLKVDQPAIATISGGKVNFPPGHSTVLLAIRAVEDGDSDDEEIRIRIDAANLPESYSVGERDTWTVNIIDKDKFTVSFSEPTGGTEEDGDAATVDLEIFPPLAANIAIPLIMEDDSDVYSMITAAAPDGASISSDGTMVGFNRAEDADSVTLSLVPARDDDRFDDEITLTIDAAKLPKDYEVSLLPSAINSWTVKITDIDKRIVSFESAENASAMESGDAVTNQLTISPALADDVAIPLRITGGDAYSISTDSSDGVSYSDGMVSFMQDEEDKSATLEFRAVDDSDNRDETITLAIDEDSLPPGYGVGDNPTWTINVADNDTGEVGFRYANTHIWGAQSLPEGDIFPHLQIYVSPALESGQTLAVLLLMGGDEYAYSGRRALRCKLRKQHGSLRR